MIFQGLEANVLILWKTISLEPSEILPQSSMHPVLPQLDCHRSQWKDESSWAKWHSKREVATAGQLRLTCPGPPANTEAHSENTWTRSATAIWKITYSTKVPQSSPTAHTCFMHISLEYITRGPLPSKAQWPEDKGDFESIASTQAPGTR